MIDRRKNTRRLIWAVTGGAFASLIAFIASPLSVGLLGELKFAQLSLWIILVTFVQVLDFGFSQNTTRKCTNVNTSSEKTAIVHENNSIFLLLICVLAPLSLFVPKPISPTYETITETDWIIFKLSIILNLKIIYNQCALIIHNRQIDFIIFQNAIVFVRFIVPIFVYYMSNDFTVVLIYFLVSTLVIIYVTDLRLGLRWHASLGVTMAILSFRDQIKPSFYLYTSGALAIILGVLDRVLGSYLFNVDGFAEYVATFTLASAVNIVVLPFYRFFVGGLRASNRVYNQKNALRISAIQSYACLLAVGFICLYGVQVIQMLGLAFPINVSTLIIFTLSFWGAANGWIIAAEIMLHSRPTLQAKLIAVTMGLYFAYLVFRRDHQAVDLAMIWVIHGVIQTFVCPLWMSDKFRLSRYTYWLRHVVLTPSFVVGSLILASYWASSLNAALSPIIFTSGALLLSILVIRGGAMERIA